MTRDELGLVASGRDKDRGVINGEGADDIIDSLLSRVLRLLTKAMTFLFTSVVPVNFP